VGEAIIAEVTATPTHDGEAALVVILTFPGGGRGSVQMSGIEAAEVVRRAAVSTPQELIGKPWSVLQIRETSFV
jgi:hypothetical protein